MKYLELKVPPLPLAVAMGAVMWAIDWWLPLQGSRTPSRTVIAGAMFIIAVAITTIAVLGFRKARTTVNPMAPEAASAIVSTGVYRFTRNPMYLGFLLALVAWAVFLGNFVSALVPVLFVAYMNRFQIAPEERALHARFGETYETYLRSVRRWL
jgi:protein-S-isoprenylcysteine O-methyltransferase Ste14